MKLPASQFYWADWLRDPAVRASSLEARGLWMDLLAHMHAGTPRGFLRVNDNAVTEAQIARMVGEPPPRIRKLLAELERNGVFARAEDGAIYSRRMVRDEDLRVKRGEFGKLSLNHPNVPRPKESTKVAGRIPSMDTIPGSIGGSPSVAVAVASSTALQTTPTNYLPAPRKKRAARPSGESAPRATWLTPIGAAWEARYAAGSFDYGQAARECGALTKAGHSPEEIAKRLAWYLENKGSETVLPREVLERRSFTPSLRDFRLRFGQFDRSADVEV